MRAGRHHFPRFYSRRKYDTRLKSKRGGRLELDLGRGNDNLHVRKLRNGLYRFDTHDKTTGRRQRFDLTRDQVSRLTVKMGRGKDKAVIDASVDQPFSLQGNGGRDEIYNAAHGMRLDGGKRKDKIVNSGSFVHMRGDRITDHGMYNSVDLRGSGRDSYTTTNGWGTVIRADHRDRINGLTSYDRAAMWGRYGMLPFNPIARPMYQPCFHTANLPAATFQALAHAAWVL